MLKKPEVVFKNTRGSWMAQSAVKSTVLSTCEAASGKLGKSRCAARRSARGKGNFGERNCDGPVNAKNASEGHLRFLHL